MSRSLRKFYRKNYLLLLIILIGFIHGVIYVFIAPPWAHYDEPTHFEYAWMIANRTLTPKAGEYDNALRRQILESMVRHNFYKVRSWEIDVSTLQDPVNIGINQLGDPPVYYLLASIPLRLMRQQPIENQLIACRFVSLILFLVAVWVGWKFGEVITGENNPMRWMIPLSMVLLPPLVELMTAVNNDSAAVLVYSLFLLFGVKLLKNGPHWTTILALILLTIIGFYTKSSTWLMVVAMVIAVLVSLFRKRIILAWGVVLLVILISLIAIFEWGDAALWYRDTFQNETTRIYTQVNGENAYAFRLLDDSTEYNAALYQTLLAKDISSLFGTKITIGAWMWADEPITVNPPQIMFINPKGRQRWISAEPITLTNQPVFYAYVIRLPIESWRTFISLKPFNTGEQIGNIYIANPVIASGVFDVKQPPVFSDTNASYGEWAGKPFNNLVRNAGALQGWPKIRNYIYKITSKIDYRLTEGIGRVIYTLDFKGTFWYTKSTLLVIFRSFWAKFGWGEVTLIGSKPYRAFYIATIIMLIGCLIGLFKKFNLIGLHFSIWLGLNIFLSLGFAWFTGISMNSYIGKPYIPVARFIFPVILAIFTFWCFGWVSWMEFVHKRFRWITYAIYILLFLLLDGLSIASVIAHYQV